MKVRDLVSVSTDCQLDICDTEENLLATVNINKDGYLSGTYGYCYNVSVKVVKSITPIHGYAIQVTVD